MAIEVQLSDLLGLYGKAGARILGRVSDRFINGFHQVFKIDDDLRHDYFRDKGISLARRHRYLQAQKLLIELHQEFPDDFEVSLYLGICYFKTGKNEKALPLLESSLKERPDNQRLRSVLVKVYSVTGDQQKLLKLLRENREARVDDYDVNLQLAIALDRAGEVDEAIEVLQKVLEIDEDSLKAHRLIAVLYESQGESSKASTHHRRVIELEEGEIKLSPLMEDEDVSADKAPSKKPSIETKNDEDSPAAEIKEEEATEPVSDEALLAANAAQQKNSTKGKGQAL